MDGDKSAYSKPLNQRNKVTINPPTLIRLSPASLVSFPPKKHWLANPEDDWNLPNDALKYVMSTS